MDADLYSAAQLRDQTPLRTLDARTFMNTVNGALHASGRLHVMHRYTQAEYAAMRMFLTPDSLSGFALDNRDLVSVFSHPDAPRGRLVSLVKAATGNGARTLDVFDVGGLPEAYTRCGFAETHRAAWDDAQKPENWPAGGGRPDVVFMSFKPKVLRVLVGCSCSGITRQAFRDLGHDAWSADLKPAEDHSPHHLTGDVRGVMREGWDIGIFHPTCRYMANSGGRWLYVGGRSENGRNVTRWQNMEKGVELFMDCMNAPIERKATENPVMHKHAKKLVGRQQTQVIQPWMFGHMETKATCLWLENLPKLEETDNVYEAMMKLPYSERARVHNIAPGPDREADRSRALPGISAAMAMQWGGVVQN